MSYKTAQNITPIDMLPNLEDIDGPQPFERAVKGPQIKASRYPGEEYIPPDQAKRIQRVIRENHEAPRDSGMNYDRPDTQTYIPENSQINDQYQQPMIMNQEPELNCSQCYNHTSACKICKNFYGNDKTIYIITIIVLALICLLLLKKVLDV